MKCVFRGNPPSEEIWISTCPNCFSRFEAFQRELKIESCQRDGDFARETCEVCKSSIFFYPPRKGR